MHSGVRLPNFFSEIKGIPRWIVVKYYDLSNAIQRWCCYNYKGANGLLIFFCSLSGLLCQIYYFFFEISIVHNDEARENPVFLSPQATLVPDPFGSFSYIVYLCFATTSQVKSK